MAKLITQRMRLDGPDRENRSEVHSGHFMISSVVEQDDIDDEVSHDRDSPVHHDQALRLRQGYDFSQVRKETQNTYQFGPRSTNQITIDASLSRLFECMSLAYRGGKVVSPKWKNFKGMRLSVKDKIRLNNAIWRTWHIQYIQRRRRSKISFVQFATPLDNESDCDSHSKPEAVVMEGKYWKRRIETVVAEYKKWRAFFMEKWVSNNSPSTPELILSDQALRQDPIMDFDRLLSCLSQPFQFPNPREIAQHATNSDMMQPGLLQLQPMIEDYMDPLDDIFSLNRKTSNSSNVSLFYAGPNFQSSPQGNDFNSGLIMQQDLHGAGLQETSLEELVERAAVDQDPNAMCVSQSGMEMQQMPQTMQQPSINFGVSDPMLTPVNEKMFVQNDRSVQGATVVTVPMMASKQQQPTQTITQIVTAHSHHHHDATFSQKQAGVMPPPQKKAPRKRSSLHRTQGEVGGSRGHMNSLQMPQLHTNVVVQSQSNIPNMTPLNYATMPELVEVTMTPAQDQTPMNITRTSAPPQVIIPPNPNIVNFTVSSHATFVPMDKLIYSKPQTSINVQTVDRDMIIDSMNANNNLLPTVLIRRKENLTQSSTMMDVTPPQQQAASNSGNFDQPPLKKLLVPGRIPSSEVHITVKNPSPTTQMSQSSILTQLLQTGVRPSDRIKSSQLQIPSNQVFTPVKEAQLRKVQEQAANFNNFQNSLVLAAAQLVSPQTQHTTASVPNVSPVQHIVTSLQNVTPIQNVAPRQHVTLPHVTRQHSATAASTIANIDIRNQQVTLSALSNVNEAVRPFLAQFHMEKDTEVEESPKPAFVSTNTMITMDTDEGEKTDSKAIETDQKTLFTSITTEATTSSSSPTNATGDQRPSHYTTEQIRRCNMKNSLKALQDMIPDTSTQPNAKVSKAVVLSKSCKYIKNLQSAREQTSNEIQKLKMEIKQLNEEISSFQEQLPVTGAPVRRKNGDRMEQYFDEWVRERTLHNWKFYIFSKIIRPWFTTYDQNVSNASLEDLLNTCLVWLEKYCSLPSLRRSLIPSFREISTTTSIISDPTTLQQQAESAVQQNSRQSGSSSS